MPALHWVLLVLRRSLSSKLKEDTASCTQNSDDLSLYLAQGETSTLGRVMQHTVRQTVATLLISVIISTLSTQGSQMRTTQQNSRRISTTWQVHNVAPPPLLC